MRRYLLMITIIAFTAKPGFAQSFFANVRVDIFSSSLYNKDDMRAGRELNQRFTLRPGVGAFLGYKWGGDNSLKKEISIGLQYVHGEYCKQEIFL